MMAPALRMPYEVLAEIFDYVVSDSELDDEAPVLMRPRLFLSHVCSFWRVVCRGRSSFWTTFTFSKKEQASMLEELLPLSAGRRLAICTFGLPSGGPDWNVVISENVGKRVIEMRLGLASDLELFKLERNFALRLVQRLTVGTGGLLKSLPDPSGPEAFLFQQIGGDYPFFNVRNLILKGTGCAWLRNFPFLESVTFESYSYQDFIYSYYAAPPKIQRLELRKFFPAPSDLVRPIAQDMSFFDEIAESKVHLKEIVVRDAMPNAMTYPLARFQLSIESFTLHNTNAMLARNCIRSSPSSQAQNLSLTDDCFNLVCAFSERHSKMTTPFPRLKTLTVRVDPSRGYLALLPDLNDGLCELLDQRRRDGSDLLERLTLDAALVASRDNEGWFREVASEVVLVPSLAKEWRSGGGGTLDGAPGSSLEMDADYPSDPESAIEGYDTSDESGSE